MPSTTVYKYLQLNRCKHPRWTDEENQILVDGYAEGVKPDKIAQKIGRSYRAVVIAMCRHRKAMKKDPRKKLTMRMITMALRAVRKADIYKELESDV